MEKEIAVVLILGGLATLDATEAFQSMWSQPLVSGPLLGWLLGDWQNGLFIGVFLQLLWLGYVPLGVAVFPDVAVGGVAGTAAFIHLINLENFEFFKVILLILVFSFGLAYLSGWLTLKNRHWNRRLAEKVEENLAAGKDRLNFYFRLALLISFVRGAVASLAGLFLILGLTTFLAGRLSNVPDEFFNFVLPVASGFGAASLFSFFGKLKSLPYLLAGGVLALFFILMR